MNKNIAKLYISFFSICLLGLASCQQEEFDNESSDQDPILVDSIVVDSTENDTIINDTIITGSCSGGIFLDSIFPALNPVLGSLGIPSAQAYILLPTCIIPGAVLPEPDTYYYIIADENFQWVGGPAPTWSANGLPGFEFQSGSPLQVGQTYGLVGDALGFTSLFTVQGGGTSNNFPMYNTQVHITEAGSAAGENIAGTIIFTSTNPLDQSSIQVYGTFCVPIVSICAN
jgi:hypothetical protein